MNANPINAASALHVYLLGNLDFEAALRFQRRMHYEVSGNCDQGVLILCEHPPLITVGRHGSRTHILCEAEELRAREWRIRWVNRGGGCLLHLPGQLAIYAIVSLDRLSLSVPRYLERLQEVIRAVLADFSIAAEVERHPPGVCVGSRVIAGMGVSVHDWVSYYGAYLNIDPDLANFRLVRWGHSDEAPMTSLVRERRAPLRSALVRERLIEHFATHFGFARTTLFSDHPALRVEKCHASEHVA